jgi:hypothetical protein
MQSWKIIAVAVTAVILGTVLTATALAYYAGGQSSYGTPFGTPYSNYGSQTRGGGMGMMGGRGMMGGIGGQGTYGNPTTYGAPTTTYGGGQWGCPMHTGAQPYYPYVANTSSISINQAAAIAQQYLLSLNNPDLAIGEVEEYALNFYVEYYEKSTGIGAFEMLIDKYSGRISPEMGSNMMWNTKYGMMTGMMGRLGGIQTEPMTITVEQAGTLAQQYLNANLPGTSVGEVMPFYGYYDVHVLAAGKTYGMLSVNGYTGQVWYHTWHGDFIQELEV